MYKFYIKSDFCIRDLREYRREGTYSGATDLAFNACESPIHEFRFDTIDSYTAHRFK